MNPGNPAAGAKMADVLHRSLVGGIVLLSGYLVVSNLVMGANFWNMHKQGQVRELIEGRGGPKNSNCVNFDSCCLTCSSGFVLWRI